MIGVAVGTLLAVFLAPEIRVWTISPTGMIENQFVMKFFRDGNIVSMNFRNGLDEDSMV